jgi:hypothetical protein
MILSKGRPLGAIPLSLPVPVLISTLDSRFLTQTNSNGLTTVANGIGFSQSVTVTGGLSVGGEVTVTSGATTAIGSISVTSAHATNSPLMAFANSVYTGNLLYARMGSVTSANALVCMEGNNLLFKVSEGFVLPMQTIV